LGPDRHHPIRTSITLSVTTIEWAWHAARNHHGTARIVTSRDGFSRGGGGGAVITDS
jgi:hypothetical protein